MLTKFVQILIAAWVRPVFFSKKYLIYTRRPYRDGRLCLPQDFNFSVISSCSEYHALIEKGYAFLIYPKHEIIEDALNSGACLILIFKEKIIAHSTWVAFESYQAKFDSLFVSGRIGLPEDAYIGPCNTFVPFRGQGLYTAALEIACHCVQSRGLSRVIINTKENNIASRRGIEKAGFNLTYVVRTVHLLGKKIIFSSSLDQNGPKWQ